MRKDAPPMTDLPTAQVNESMQNSMDSFGNIYMAPVRKLDAEIKLEEDTIDLLKADWALLTQPNRLNRLVKTFEGDLKLVPTESTQLAQPNELPMPMAELPALEPAKDEKVADGKKNTKKASGTDAIQTGSVAR